MNILTWLFKLVNYFVDVDSEEFPKIMADGRTWYNAIRIDDEVEKKGFQFYFKKYSEFWAVKLFLAVAYIFAIKSIQEWMIPKEEENTHNKF